MSIDPLTRLIRESKLVDVRKLVDRATVDDDVIVIRRHRENGQFVTETVVSPWTDPAALLGLLSIVSQTQVDKHYLREDEEDATA